MPRVLLIQPTFSEHSYAMDEVTSPMALLSIAAPLVKEGFEVRIINQQITDDWKNILLEELDRNPVCVGITSLTGLQIYFALKAARVVKENSAVPVVFGGVHVSMTPYQSLANRYVDYVLQGEAECTFPVLVKALEGSNANFAAIPGLYWKEDGIPHGNPCGPPPDLDLLDPVPFHLDRIFMEQTHPKLTVLTSRGCPHRCAFCFNNFFYDRRWRGISARKVLERIDEYLKMYGPGSVYGKEPVINFGTESNFFVNPQRVDEICEGIKDRGIPVNWEGVSCRVDYHEMIKTQTLDKLYALGCRRLLFGVEAGNQNMLNRIKKDIKISDAFSMAQKVTDSGIYFHTSFIFGLPGETREDRLSVIDLVGELRNLYGKMFTYGFFFYVPFPGTELYEDGLDLGYRAPENLTDWIRVEQRFPREMPWLTADDISEIETFRKLALVGGVYSEGSLAGKVYGLLGRWGSFRLSRHLFGPVPELKIQEWLNDAYNLLVRGKKRKYQTFHHDPLFDRLPQMLHEVQ